MSVVPDTNLLGQILPRSATIVVTGHAVGDWATVLRAAGRLVLEPTASGLLGEWCANSGVRHIDWLILHQSRGAFMMLESVKSMLMLRRIDFVQFNEDEAGDDLSALNVLLRSCGYKLLRFINGEGQLCEEPTPFGQPCTYLAVAPRHHKRLLTGETTMFRYAEIFPRYGILPRGIIHIGAHEGEEYSQYVDAGCKRVLFIEADPSTYARLTPRFTENRDVICINRAVSDKRGRFPFSRMSGSQSSSLLSPKEHLGVYPSITLTETIEVDAAPLPDILRDFEVKVENYNVLAIDTQGAERMILAGCGALLSSFDAISVEVNYAELYQGCGRIADIDDLLFPHGYERVEETSPYHHTWGDAFYIHNR